MDVLFEENLNILRPVIPSKKRSTHLLKSEGEKPFDL
jgi:hypothetical protein